MNISKVLLRLSFGASALYYAVEVVVTAKTAAGAALEGWVTWWQGGSPAVFARSIGVCRFEICVVGVVVKAKAAAGAVPEGWVP